MTKEIRTESSWLSGDIQVVYENGERVGEIRTEQEDVGFLGVSTREVDVTYDNDGNKVAITRHEEDVSAGAFFTEKVDRTYNPSGDVISETRHRENDSIFPFYSNERDVINEGENRYDETGSIRDVEDFGRKYRTIDDNFGHDVDPLTRANREKQAEDKSDYQVPDSYGDYSYDTTSSSSSKERTGSFSEFITGLVLCSAVAVIGYLFSNPSGISDRSKSDSIRVEQEITYGKSETALEKLRRELAGRNNAHRKSEIENLRKNNRFKESGNVETRTYETPVKRIMERDSSSNSETVETRTYQAHTIRSDTGNVVGKPSVVISAPVKTHTEEYKPIKTKEERARAYSAVLPSSEFSQSTPKGYAPVVVRARDANGNESMKTSRMSRQEMEESKSDDIGITYHVSGNRYAIEREKYPEFFDRLDLDKDGSVSLYELGEAQSVIFKITGKKKEGDLDSIVKEFLKKYKPKRHR